MSKVRFILAVLCMAMVSSCDRELEYSISSPEATLVVNSVFAEDSIWRVDVSTTANPGGGQIKILKDATVAIFQDNVRITDLVLDSVEARATFLGENSGRNGFVQLYYQRTVTSRAGAGHLYEIRVSHPDYPTIYSANVIPRSPRLRKETYNGTIASQMIQGTPHVRIPFSILDDVGLNYYGLEVWVRTTDDLQAFERVGFYSPETELLENTLVDESSYGEQHFFPSENTVFFSNRTFAGQSKTIGVYLDQDLYKRSKEVKIRILRLSTDLYQFVTTFQKQQINQSNPFAEPAQVYSNIQNGSGIFAGYSVSDLDPR